MVTFAHLTGLRVPSEVLTLQWPQVDRKAKLIRLEPGQTKSSEGRTFPYAMLPELDDVIEARWQPSAIWSAWECRRRPPCS